MTAEIMINKVVIAKAVKPELINKIVLTAEVKLDYRNGVIKLPFPRKAIKEEVETYIDLMNKNCRLLYDNYFRVKFFDEQSDKMLLLFVYRGERFGIMQLWKLCGVCEFDDWSQEAEDDGLIRNWLKTKIEDLENEKDWVEEYRAWKEIEELSREDYCD